MALKRAFVGLWPAIQQMSSVPNLSGEARGPASTQASSAMRFHRANSTKSDCVVEVNLVDAD